MIVQVGLILLLSLLSLIPLDNRMNCAIFGLNWPRGSAEQDFLMFLMYFRYLALYISSQKKAGPFN